MPAVSVTSPLTLAAAAVILLTALIIRRRKSPLLIIAAALLAMAAGGIHFSLPRPGTVAVCVDVSPSTRTAAYRDEAHLRRRITDLIGRSAHTFHHFAEATHAGLSTREIPTTRTTFTPPGDADAILLFSDGRFAPPDSAQPIYPVLDPNLDTARDARVDSLTAIASKLTAVATNTTADARSLTWYPEDVAPAPLTRGTFTFSHDLPPAPLITTRVTGTDPWPENDTLSLRPPPPGIHERWWVSTDSDAVPSGWLPISLASLPTDSAAYLRPAVIVLHDLPASSFPPDALPRLTQYVRDLGGGLVLTGGTRAFIDYLGTGLEVLSPLATAPPEPGRHWVILLDASGSMAQADRWPRALAALDRLLPSLPPGDLVSVASFAESVTWWTRQAPARSLNGLTPPVRIPRGPTNIDNALRQIAADPSSTALPTSALLITDADLTLPALPDHLRSLRAANVSLSVLLIADHPAGPLASLARDTGGSILAQPDPARWIISLRELARTARGPSVVDTPTALRFTNVLGHLASRTVPAHHRTYPKPDTTPLSTPPLTARWSFGAGNVGALAFPATSEEVTALATALARPPADPAFSAAWNTSHELAVTVDATKGNVYINSATVTLQLDAQSRVVPQTAPGRYSLVVPYPTNGATAILRAGDRTLSHLSLPPRYPEEFAALGTDLPALARLARSTGGRVIPPDFRGPIDFHWPARPYDLTPYLASAGAAALIAHLLRYRVL